MKTPEQMAEEAIRWMKTLPPASERCNQCACEGYRAGYQAAKDEYKVAIDTYNDVAKQMLEEAVRIMSPQDHLVDADKMIDTCEHILDMEKMVDADKVMDFNKGNFAKMEKVNMKFAYDSFPVTDKQAQDVKQIRENFSLLTDVLTQLVPNGRYLSIVQTKLEEACMFAVKGITHQAGDYGNLQNKA